MKLECLGSSSSGNCYLLRAANETLIVECGIDAKEIKRALGWSLRGVVGCLVSHEHRDHSKSVKDIMRSGIPVLALADVFRSHGIERNPFARTIVGLHGYRIGGFKVYALPLAHDVPCLGFVIDHAEMGKTLFITDTMMTEYRIEGLNHIMIEANYEDSILQDSIDNGICPAGLRGRLLQSHMELRTTIGVLQSCDLSAVSDIVLLHLSSANSNAERFQSEVARATGLPTYVACKGLQIEFKEPY